MKRVKDKDPDFSAPSLATLEQERKILSDLGNDITSVRDKNDLITLFSKTIKVK